MKDRLVTICTPCYNHEYYLEDYFKSIINQTYENIELIIADDASEDQSREIIKKYMPDLKRRFKNVIYIENEENLGITKTCNKMFKLATGYYIKPMASDDILLETGISNLVSFMESHSEAMITIGNACKIPDEYKYGDLYLMCKVMNIDDLKSKKNLHDELLWSNFICSIGGIYRKELFDRCGYYDTHMIYEDWDFLLTVTKTEKIYFYDEVVCLYRKSVTSFGAYNRCEDMRTKEIKYLRMYEGGKKILEKHTAELDFANRENILKHFFVDQLYAAVDAHLLLCEKKVLADLKEKKLKLSVKENMHYILIKYFPFLIKIYRKMNVRKYS